MRFSFLQIRYKHDLDQPAAVLPIPHCGSLCGLKEFISLYKHLLPKISFKRACHAKG